MVRYLLEKINPRVEKKLSWRREAQLGRINNLRISGLYVPISFPTIWFMSPDFAIRALAS